MHTRSAFLNDSKGEPQPDNPESQRFHWLVEGNYDGPSWRVRDDNPLSPNRHELIRFDLPVYDSLRPDQRCLLTDPEYANLLNPVRRLSQLLRTGKYASCTTAAHQESVTRHANAMISWMILNGIRRYSDLSPDDFEEFSKSIVFGPAFLLKYPERIKQHIQALRENNGKVPTRRIGGEKTPRLDIDAFLLGLGIHPGRARANRHVVHQLLKLSEAEGLYLRPSQIKLLNEPLGEPRTLAEASLRTCFLPWHYLWTMRNDLPGDRIQFNPFQEVSIEQLVKELGRPGGRTKTAPVRQTMELLDHCLMWVFEYAPRLLNIRNQYEDLFTENLSSYVRLKRLERLISEADFPKIPGSPFSLLPGSRYLPSKGVDFATAVNEFIPAACIVIICAFSARRHREALTIRAGCLSRDGQGWLLETYIEKTLQDWDKTPVNEIVVYAVNILHLWSATARELSGDIRLFQFKRFGEDRTVRFDVGDSIRLFVDFLQLSPLPDGSFWVFTPHQFRRFFAIIYFWRYQYGDLAALSYHLRHFNPARTLVYLTEIELGAIFRQVGKEFTTTILTQAALGERNVSGPFGERFKSTARKLRGHFRRAVKVVSPRLVQRMVERYMEKSNRIIRPVPWGYCVCGTLPHQLKAAKCLENNPAQERFAPDLSNSSPTTCANCPHHMTEHVFEKFTRDELKSNEQAAADPQIGPLLRNLSNLHSKTLRRHFERSFEDSQPLEVLDAKTHR